MTNTESEEQKDIACMETSQQSVLPVAGLDLPRHRDVGGRFVASVGGDWGRFWALVDVDPRSGCWLWRGRLTADKYPLFDVRAGGRWRPVRAHRWAWEQTYGPLAAGLTLDHLVLPDGPCTSTRCVRPTASALGWHLEAVTNAENLRRRHARARQENQR